MAIEYVYPNGDVTTEWNAFGEGEAGSCTDCSESAHYACVEQGCSSPADDCGLSVESFGAKERYDLTDPALEGGTCTAIRVCLRCSRGSGGGNITVRIFDGATQIGGNKTVTPPVEPTVDNRWTVQWSGLSKSADDLSDLRVEIQDPDDFSPQYVYEITVELEYTPGGPSGVDEVNDVANASIDSVNGVSLASISQINDVG